MQLIPGKDQDLLVRRSRFVSEDTSVPKSYELINDVRLAEAVQQESKKIKREESVSIVKQKIEKLKITNKTSSPYSSTIKVLRNLG